MSSRVRVLAVGTRMPAWVQSGVDEYRKRLPRDYAVELREIPVSRRGGERGVKEEGAALLAALTPDELVVCMEVDGNMWSTAQLADRMRDWRDQARRVELLIGGPDGLAAECRVRADLHWSLSRLTLPHALVRVVLMEQIYRAWSILNLHPYHR